MAKQAHYGQKDKNGKPYLYHPFRVMCNMQTTEEMTVAILHDVVEDTVVTIALLQGRGFDKAITNAIDAISRRPGEKLRGYLERVKQNPLALKVKFQDIVDNMCPSRLGKLPDRDRERLGKKYAFCLKFLSAKEEATS